MSHEGVTYSVFVSRTIDVLCLVIENQKTGEKAEFYENQLGPNQAQMLRRLEQLIKSARANRRFADLVTGETTNNSSTPGQPKNTQMDLGLPSVPFTITTFSKDYPDHSWQIETDQDFARFLTEAKVIHNLPNGIWNFEKEKNFFSLERHDSNGYVDRLVWFMWKK